MVRTYTYKKERRGQAQPSKKKEKKNTIGGDPKICDPEVGTYQNAKVPKYQSAKIPKGGKIPKYQSAKIPKCQGGKHSMSNRKEGRKWRENTNQKLEVFM